MPKTTDDLLAAFRELGPDLTLDDLFGSEAA